MNNEKCFYLLINILYRKIRRLRRITDVINAFNLFYIQVTLKSVFKTLINLTSFDFSKS